MHHTFYSDIFNTTTNVTGLSHILEDELLDESESEDFEVNADLTQSSGDSRTALSQKRVSGNNKRAASTLETVNGDSKRAARNLKTVSNDNKRAVRSQPTGNNKRPARSQIDRRQR